MTTLPRYPRFSRVSVPATDDSVLSPHISSSLGQELARKTYPATGLAVPTNVPSLTLLAGAGRQPVTSASLIDRQSARHIPTAQLATPYRYRESSTSNTTALEDSGDGLHGVKGTVLSEDRSLLTRETGAASWPNYMQLL